MVIVRTAPVLGKRGVLAPLWNMAKLNCIATISKKDFFFPWIHINDAVRVYLFALETNTLQGIVNAVSPTPTRYFEYIKAFKKITKSISIGKAPFLKAVFGDLVSEITINQRIVPQRLSDKGFTFSFTDVEEAIRAIKQ